MILRIRVIWVSGIGEIATGSKQSFDLLDRLTDRAGWLARLKLALQLNECLIGGVETSRQHPRNVEEHDRVLREQGRVSNVKLRVFRGMHIRSVRLVQQRRDFAEHGARLRYFGNLDALFDY